MPVGECNGRFLRSCVMKKFAWIVATFGALAIFGSPAVAQDYRARVQGSVLDESKGVLPGVSVTLRNDATGVAVTRITDDRKSTRLNSSHVKISYAVFCLK